MFEITLSNKPHIYICTQKAVNISNRASKGVKSLSFALSIQVLSQSHPEKMVSTSQLSRVLCVRKRFVVCGIFTRERGTFHDCMTRVNNIYICISKSRSHMSFSARRACFSVRCHFDENKRVTGTLPSPWSF